MSHRFIINDSYKTHLSLLYPPYMIALAALYLAFSLEDKSSADSHRLRGKVLMPFRIGDEKPDEVPVYYIQKPNTQVGAEGQTQSTSGNGHGVALSSGTDPGLRMGDFEPIKLLTRTNAPRLFASLDISLPMLLSIVQQLVSLYPLWDSFAPRRTPGTGTPGSASSANDPKAHLMAYRAAQALRRAQAVDKEREAREMALNARESTRAQLQANAAGKPPIDDKNDEPVEKAPAPPVSGDLFVEQEKIKRYPEQPVRFPPGPHLTEEGVPTLLTTLWREVANRQEREREAKRLG